MINFFEDNSPGYTSRTRKNVLSSDITIAFAVNPNSPGERQTMNFADNASIPFYSFQINENTGHICWYESSKVDELISKIISFNRPVRLNIAGNGIATFSRYNITQERVDELVYNFLSHLLSKGCQFSLIRSGGQTGADESGLKAAERLGIRCICLCPQGWRFRDSSNKDIYDKEAFKKRFI